ncbi:MAG: M20 family metallo-hydrolase [Myxococcota bacterium]|nr:M20 family metallo-hydrolase [Myxococcota bacterium]
MGLVEVKAYIDTLGDQVIALQKDLVAIPALSPTYDPTPDHCGERQKADFLKDYLQRNGITDVVEISAPDARVPGGLRPNLIARINGRSRDRTVWIMAHMDVVPPGDLSKWQTDPYALSVDGDVIYGRGVEDNHQGLVSGIMAVRGFLETGTVPEYDIGLLIVADEECGSAHGIQYVLANGNPFEKDDLIIVPDGGAPDGSEVEVAEKGIAWIKFHVSGVQCHASTPDKGKNAMHAGAHLIVALDALGERFDREDPMFEPSRSTFAPTRKLANVPNINTIPGDDVFYLDCRVLPGYSLDEVEAEIRKICDTVSKRFGVSISLAFEQREVAAPPTPVDAPVVRQTIAAVKAVYGVDARPIGVGGGTVAAYLRRRALSCVVWSRMDETMHSPNENAKISNILGDAKVIAHIAASKCSQ